MWASLLCQSATVNLCSFVCRNLMCVCSQDIDLVCFFPLYANVQIKQLLIVVTAAYRHVVMLVLRAKQTHKVMGSFLNKQTNKNIVQR